MSQPIALIYDLEIIKAIPPRDPNDKIPGIEYCAGWDDHASMGISVIGAYDYGEQRHRTFCQDNFDEFSDLAMNRADILVGFNNIHFDNKVLRASGIEIPRDDSGVYYDLLREVWAGAGLGPDYIHPTHAGYGLDAVCEVEFGLKKTGNGAYAPVLWQQGKYGQVIDYCLNDIVLTKRLLDHVVEYGWIVCPKTQKKIEVRRP